MATLCVVVAGSLSPLRADDDLLLYIPTMIAGLQFCEVGEFDQCKTSGGCAKINGNWASGNCTMKSSNQLDTEVLAGKWASITSFSDGDFFNYLQFFKSAKPLSGSPDYYIEGASHSTSAYADPVPNNAVGSYDSSNNDWFILDFWGLGQGTISSIELNRSNNSLFIGCEFLVNYPDLTYQDGVCNPIRFARVAQGKLVSKQATAPTRRSQRSKSHSLHSAARVAGSSVSNNIILMNSAKGANHE